MGSYPLTPLFHHEIYGDHSEIIHGESITCYELYQTDE